MIIINNEVNMIISSANDYRQVAKRKVPPFMFHYADGALILNIHLHVM